MNAGFTPNYSKGESELKVVFAGEGSTVARVEYEKKLFPELRVAIGDPSVSSLLIYSRGCQ
eukprot:4780261-Pyramimonas_sp.AAC.1